MFAKDNSHFNFIPQIGEHSGQHASESASG